MEKDKKWNKNQRDEILNEFYQYKKLVKVIINWRRLQANIYDQVLKVWMKKKKKNKKIWLLVILMN